MKIKITKDQWIEAGKKAGYIKESQFEPKMMPGQEPYTPEQQAILNDLIEDASRADVTEQNEEEIMEDTRNRKNDLLDHVKTYEPDVILKAIKLLGEESIAGFSDVKIEDLDEVLLNCEEYDLRDILGILQTKEVVESGKNMKQLIKKAQAFIRREITPIIGGDDNSEDIGIRPDDEVNRGDERLEIIRELEAHADDPNVRGTLVRCRDSQYYRPSPAGAPVSSEPTIDELKMILERVRYQV